MTECFHCGNEVSEEEAEKETPLCLDCKAIGISRDAARKVSEIGNPFQELSEATDREGEKQ
mgnify:CR=1 FL=1